MSKKPNKGKDDMEDDSPPRRDESPTRRQGPARDPDGWSHILQFNMIAHPPGVCEICSHFINHTLDAQIRAEPSYREANSKMNGYIYEREEHFQRERNGAERDLIRAREQISAQAQRIQELEVELARERVRSSQPNSAHSRATPYERPTGVTTTRHRVGLARSTRVVPTTSYAEAAGLAASTTRGPGVPGPSGSSSGSTSSRTLPPPPRVPKQMTGDISLLDEMSSDDSNRDVDEENAVDDALGDQAIIRESTFGRAWSGAMRALAKSEAGRAIDADFIAAHHLSDPTSRAEFLFIEELMIAYSSEALVHYLGMFKSRAQALSRTRRTPAMHHMLRHWKRPAHMKAALKSEGPQPGSSNQPGSSAQPRTRPSKGPNPKLEMHRIARDLNIEETEENLQNLGNVTSPNNAAHPEVWQSFYLNYAGPQTSAWGLGRRPGVRINQRELRTMLRFRGMFTITRLPQGAVDVIGLRTRIIGYTILATPGRYQALLHAGNLAVADTYSHTRHELAEDQVNDMNVARIMAMNGVTPIEADDAWAFANGWLEDTFANPQTHEAVRDLVRTSIESTRKTSPPVGGGLPEVVPVIWDAALKRWRPDPTVIAAGNANRQIHVVQNGAVVPTLISAGNAASETTTNTIPTPGDAEMSAPVETSAVSEDTTMSSQDPPPPHGDPASSEPAAGAESTMDTHE
jgi:hypothetical protein